MVACSDEAISSVQPAIARIGAADASPQLILSAGRGASPPLRRIRRSNAVKSARFRRSAKKAAVFMAASFSETAVATNWLMLNSVCLGAALDFRLHRAGQAERVGTLRAFHVLILLSNSAGDNTSIPNVAGVSPKSRRLNVTIAAAWPFTAASSTSSSAGSRSWGRHMKCVSTGSTIASTASRKMPTCC